MSFADICKKIVLSLALAFFIFIILMNFIAPDQVSMNLFYILLVIAILSLLLPKSFYNKAFAFYKKYQKLFLIIAIVCSLAARFSFTFLYYEPVSDPNNFMIAANAFGETGNFGQQNQYIAFHPYLAPYSIILSVFIKLFGNSNLSVIILNTLLDSTAAFVLYILIRQLTKNKSSAITAVTLWILNPANIIFTALSMPLLAVNAGILSTILLFYIIYTKMKGGKTTKGLYLWSLFGGVVAGLTNCFRPIIIILLIGLAITFFLDFFKKKLSITLILISLIFIFVPFLAIGRLNAICVSRITGYPIATHTSGWSIFLGANYNSKGAWNQEDGDYRNQLFQTYQEDINIISAQLQQEAMDRYVALIPYRIFPHLLNKSFTLTAGQRNIFYNIDAYPQIYSRNYIMDILRNLQSLYFLFITAFATIFIYRTYHQSPKNLHPIIFCVAISLVGLFLASLLVEVSVRYFTTFFPFIVILASLGLHGSPNHSSNSSR